MFFRSFYNHVILYYPMFFSHSFSSVFFKHVFFPCFFIIFFKFLILGLSKTFKRNTTAEMDPMIKPENPEKWAEAIACFRTLRILERHMKSDLIRVTRMEPSRCLKVQIFPCQFSWWRPSIGGYNPSRGGCAPKRLDINLWAWLLIQDGNNITDASCRLNRFLR